MNINQEEWHRRYKQQIINSSGLSDQEAQDCLDAGMGEYDYNENPEDMALSEMSYWDEGDE